MKNHHHFCWINIIHSRKDCDSIFQIIDAQQVYELYYSFLFYRFVLIYLHLISVVSFGCQTRSHSFLVLLMKALWNDFFFTMELSNVSWKECQGNDSFCNFLGILKYRLHNSNKNLMLNLLMERVICSIGKVEELSNLNTFEHQLSDSQQ